MGPLRFVLCSVLLVSAHSFAADYARVGTLQKDGNWELGITFADSVDLASTIIQDNYRLSSGDLNGIRRVPQNGAIVLTANGLVDGTPCSCTLTNIKARDGSDLAALTLAFTPTNFSWVAIGSQELGFTPDAIAVGENGFDLVSGGFQLFDVYDEATFVYESLTGDFDKHVRVEYQDPSSKWARAGLMVRESLDAGKPRPADPTDPAEAFSRYIEVHVTPTATAYGEPATNIHQVNFRPYLGGIGSPNFEPTENPPLQNNAPAPYPNAWLRIKRTGQIFDIFRADDGTNWIQLGSFSFPTNDVDGNTLSPFSKTVYVGPSYSPENGNIPVGSGARAAFLARFRDYGGTGTPGGGGDLSPLQITKAANGDIQISWTGPGTLQVNTTLNPATWTDILGAPNPYTVPTPRPKTSFYRLKS